MSGLFYSLLNIVGKVKMEHTGKKMSISLPAPMLSKKSFSGNSFGLSHPSLLHQGVTIMQSDPILGALRVPGELRTEKDLTPIIEFVKGLKFFHSFSYYPQTVAQIATRLELHSYVNGSHIFHEGEVGSLFYVILDGEVSIYKRKRVQSMDSVLENVLLVKLGCGQHFGETALESKDGLRTASAIASKTSNLLVLHREDYLTILSQFKVLLKVAVKRSLQMPSSIWSHLPERIIDSLSEVAVIRSFTPNSTIYISGTRISSIMIVRSGLVKLIKPISKAEYEDAIVEIEKKIKNQSLLPKIPTTSRTLRSASAVHRNSRAFNESKKETPPGHWILTRSEDYVAKSKMGSTYRDNIVPETNMEAMISSYHRLASSFTPTNSGRKGSKPGTNNEESKNASPAGMKANNNRMASGDQVEFTVGVLMSGDVLGEVAILDFENITPLTAIASTSVELYCIDVEVLIELGIPRDEKIMRSLLDDWKFRNPPPSEIRKKFQVKYEWEVKKKSILRDLIK